MATTRYNIGDRVYALDRTEYDGVLVPIAIHVCTIISIHISEECVEYNLKGYYDEKEWSFSVDEDDINKDLQVLARKLEF